MSAATPSSSVSNGPPPPRLAMPANPALHQAPPPPQPPPPSQQQQQQQQHQQHQQPNVFSALSDTKPGTIPFLVRMPDGLSTQVPLPADSTVDDLAAALQRDPADPAFRLSFGNSDLDPAASLLDTNVVEAYEHAGSLLQVIAASQSDAATKAAALDSACAVVESISNGIKDMEALCAAAMANSGNGAQAPSTNSTATVAAAAAAAAAAVAAGAAAGAPNAPPLPQQHAQPQHLQQVQPIPSAHDPAAAAAFDLNATTAPTPPSPSALAFSLSKRLPNLFPPGAAAAALSDPSDPAAQPPPPLPPPSQPPPLQKLAPIVAQPSLTMIRDARRRAREALRASADELPSAAERAAEEVTIGHSTYVMEHPNLAEGGPAPHAPGQAQEQQPRPPQGPSSRNAPQLMLANSGKTTWLEDVSKTWQVGLVRDSGMLQSTKEGQEINKYLTGLEQEVARESCNENAAEEEEDDDDYDEGDDDDNGDDDDRENPSASPSTATTHSPSQGNTEPEDASTLDGNMISPKSGMPSSDPTRTLPSAPRRGAPLVPPVPSSQALPPPHPLSRTPLVGRTYPSTSGAAPNIAQRPMSDVSGGDTSDDNESVTRSVREVMANFALTDKSVPSSSSISSVHASPGAMLKPAVASAGANVSPQQQPSIVRSAPAGLGRPIVQQQQQQQPIVTPHGTPQLGQQQPRIGRAGTAPLAAAIAAAAVGSPASKANSSSAQCGPMPRRQATRIAPAPALLSGGAPGGGGGAPPPGGAGVRIAPAPNGAPGVFPAGPHMFVGPGGAVGSGPWMNHAGGRPGVVGQKKRGRKRKNPELTEEERALVRKEQNRESARLSRVRRKVIAAEYEGRLNALIGENAMLRKQVEGLNDRLVYLQSLLTITVRPESGQTGGASAPTPSVGTAATAAAPAGATSNAPPPPNANPSAPMQHHHLQPPPRATVPVSISPAPARP